MALQPNPSYNTDNLLEGSLLFQNIPAPFGIHSVDSLPAGQLRLPTQGGPRNSHQGLGFISVLQEAWAHCRGCTWPKWAGCGEKTRNDDSTYDAELTEPPLGKCKGV